MARRRVRGEGPGGLAAELKKRRPFEHPEQEAALNLMRTADWLGLEFGRLFRQHGLSAPQYNVLRILRGEGAPLPSLEIAARMVTGVPDITRLIDRLEGAGLVARKRCEEDRRVVYVALTDAGAAALEGLDGPVLDLHRRLLGHLGREDLATLSRLLVEARRGAAAPDEA
jgi:MarR family transcriptional regulator, 2-MHQ and catechol-resistance regulon repressor